MDEILKELKENLDSRLLRKVIESRTEYDYDSYISGANELLDLVKEEWTAFELQKSLEKEF